jgi:ADP-ribose pyrophosphatase YjhB (NUDIX family)
MPNPESYLAWLRSRIGHAFIPLSYSTAIVRDPGGRILLHRRSDFDVWGLPGGVLEPGESPSSCAIRETLEETGLRIRPTRLAAVLSSPEHSVRYPNGDQAQQVSPYLVCEVIGGQIHSYDSESSAVAFFDPDALPEVFPWYRLAIYQALHSEEVYFDPPIDPPADKYPNPIWKAIREKTGPGPLVLPGATALIRDENGGILMMRRTDTGRWWLPGGLMELGESLASTAIREVREEVGLEVEPIRVAGIFAGHRAQFSGPDQLFPLSTWFDCKVRSGTCKPDQVEADRVEFFPPHRLPELPAGLPERIEKILASPLRAFFQ